MTTRDGNDDDDMTDEERERLRKYADDLLSSCQRIGSKVYVLESMEVWSKKRAARIAHRTAFRSFVNTVHTLGLSLYHSPINSKGRVVQRSVAIVAEKTVLDRLKPSGEYFWLREVEYDEILETPGGWILLQPQQIRRIDSDFVRIALQNHLTSNGNNAKLAVEHCAGTLLLEFLDEDMSLIPDKFAHVVEAVDEVLAEQSWFYLTEEIIGQLVAEVVKRVDAT